LFVRRRGVGLRLVLEGRSILFEWFSVTLAPAVRFEHQSETRKVVARRRAFDAEELFERRGPLGVAARVGEAHQGLARQLARVTAQERSRVANLAGNEGTRQPEAELFIVGGSELASAQLYVLVRRRSRHGSQPAAVRHVYDRYAAPGEFV